MKLAFVLYAVLLSSCYTEALPFKALRLRRIPTLRGFLALKSSPREMNEAPEDATDEEWLSVLRTHRKAGAPKKVLQAAQERSDAGELSQAMVIKAFRTLERMSRDDLALKLLPLWHEIMCDDASELDYGSAFVLINACCKRQKLDDARRICAICGLYFDDDSSLLYDKHRLDQARAVGLMVEMILGYQAADDYQEALALLLRMQRYSNGESQGLTISEEDSRQVMKRFLKGTAEPQVLRQSLRALLLLGGLREKESLQMVTNTFALSIRFIKGAVSYDTLPVVTSTPRAYRCRIPVSTRTSEDGDEGSTLVPAKRGEARFEERPVRDEYVEVAFIGRSNVGKSSLINMMCNRKGLAYTSKTPGKTAEFNYFELRSRYNDLVDLYVGAHGGAGGGTGGGGSAEGKGRAEGISDAFEGRYKMKKNDWDNAASLSRGTGAGAGAGAGAGKKRGAKHRRSQQADSSGGGQPPSSSSSPSSPSQGADEEGKKEEKMRMQRKMQQGREAVRHVNSKMMFVDLPGLGYAERSRAMKERWLGLLGEYVSGRGSLRVLCHLVDSRHGMLDVDKECLMLLETLPDYVTYVIVLTKVDKSRESAVRGIMQKIQNDIAAATAAGRGGGPGRVVPVVCTSSETSAGGSRLWSVVLESIASGHNDGEGGGDEGRSGNLASLSQSAVDN